MSDRRLINLGPRPIPTFDDPSDVFISECAFAATQGFIQIVIEKRFQLNSIGSDRVSEESAYARAYQING